MRSIADYGRNPRESRRAPLARPDEGVGAHVFYEKRMEHELTFGEYGFSIGSLHVHGSSLSILTNPLHAGVCKT
jgi:hypothetical protein